MLNTAINCLTVAALLTREPSVQQMDTGVTNYKRTSGWCVLDTVTMEQVSQGSWTEMANPSKNNWKRKGHALHPSWRAQCRPDTNYWRCWAFPYDYTLASRTWEVLAQLLMFHQTSNFTMTILTSHWEAAFTIALPEVSVSTDTLRTCSYTESECRSVPRMSWSSHTPESFRYSTIRLAGDTLDVPVAHWLLQSKIWAETIEFSQNIRLPKSCPAQVTIRVLATEGDVQSHTTITPHS